MKLKLTLCLLAAITLATQLQAQTFQWAKSGGNIDENFSPSSVIDKSGNTWSTVNYSGTYNLSGFEFTSAGSQDFIISRFNKNGNCVFAVNCGGAEAEAALSVEIDQAGSALIIVGTFTGTTNILGEVLVSNGIGDAFVASMALDGTLNWIKQLGGLQQDVYEDVAVDRFGYIYVTGYVESDITFAGSTWLGDGWPAIIVSKYSPSGVEMWLRKGDGIDGSDWSMFGKIEVDNDQNVYYGGIFYGQLNLGAFTMLGGNPHMFFAKLNTSGVPVWAKDLGDSGGAFYWDMDIDRSGNIYVGGQFGYEMTFGGVTLNTPEVFGNNGYLARVNGIDGSFGWIKQVFCDGNSQIHGVKVIHKNLVVAVGEYQNSASYDDLLLYNDALPEYDGMLIKANTATGAGVQTFAFNADAYMTAQQVGFDKVGDIYITGGYKSTLTLDGTEPLTSLGGYDVLFLKISGLLPREENEETNEIEFLSAISIYPNPAVESITISFNNITTSDDYIKIIDILGNEILVKNLDGIEETEINIDISSLAPGIYFATTREWSTRFLKVN